MDTLKARKIVGDMVRLSLNSIIPEENLNITSRLSEFSLSELNEANSILENSKKESYVGEDGETYTRNFLTLDDRLIAAIYVLLNYEAQDSADCNAIVEFKSTGVYVVK